MAIKKKTWKSNVTNKSSNCLICKEKLKSFRHLLVHITTKHFKSAVNKLITLKYPGFWVSERAMDGKAHTCSECGQKMFNRGQLQKHIGVDHNQLWETYLAHVRDKGISETSLHVSVNEHSPESPPKKRRKEIQEVLETELLNGNAVSKIKKKKGKKRGRKPKNKKSPVPHDIPQNLCQSSADTRLVTKSPDKSQKKSNLKKGEETIISPVDKKLSLIPDEDNLGEKSSNMDKHITQTSLETNSTNIFEEIESNLASSLKEPYCTICQILLEPNIRAKLLTEVSKSTKKVPMQSAIWIPFQETKLTPSVKYAEGCPISLLLVCQRCKLCVHSACYGEVNVGSDWQCQRCNHDLSSSSPISCKLCGEGGNDLRLTVDSEYVHVTCALLVPEVEISSSGLIDLTTLPRKRKNLSCSICEESGFKTAVHCQASKECQIAFHPSCAIKNNVDIVVGPDQKLIMRCSVCIDNFNLSSTEAVVTKYHPKDIDVGEQVIVKDDAGEPVVGEVKEIIPETYYSVAFDDGTFCDNLDPQDVTFVDKTDEISENCPVTCPWEGVIYSGVFKGSNILYWYKVGTEDGKLVELDRTMLTKLPS